LNPHLGHRIVSSSGLGLMRVSHLGQNFITERLLLILFFQSCLEQTG
jgi:hypothetical protein